MKMDFYLKFFEREEDIEEKEKVKQKLLDFIKNKRLASLSDVWNFLFEICSLRKDVYKPLCELLEQGKIRQIEIGENVFFKVMGAEKGEKPR